MPDENAPLPRESIDTETGPEPRPENFDAIDFSPENTHENVDPKVSEDIKGIEEKVEEETKAEAEVEAELREEAIDSLHKDAGELPKQPFDHDASLPDFEQEFPKSEEKGNLEEEKVEASTGLEAAAPLAAPQVATSQAKPTLTAQDFMDIATAKTSVPSDSPVLQTPLPAAPPAPPSAASAKGILNPDDALSIATAGTKASTTQNPAPTAQKPAVGSETSSIDMYSKLASLLTNPKVDPKPLTNEPVRTPNPPPITTHANILKQPETVNVLEAPGVGVAALLKELNSDVTKASWNVKNFKAEPGSVKLEITGGPALYAKENRQGGLNFSMKKEMNETSKDLAIQTACKISVDMAQPGATINISLKLSEDQKEKVYNFLQAEMNKPQNQGKRLNIEGFTPKATDILNVTPPKAI